jgi:hypothetical protein
MSNKLKIRKLYEKDEDKTTLSREINPILPDVSKKQLILILGGVSTGKTTMLTNLLYSDDFYNNIFQLKYIISPSIYNDRSARAFREDENAILLDMYSDEAIEQIIENQKLDEGDSFSTQPFSLLLLDDCVEGNHRGTGSNNSKISQLCTRFRHLNLNIILSAQSINQGFSSLIRCNCRSIILKKLRNTSEKKKFQIQFSDLFGGEDNFNSMYSYVFDGNEDKYNFLYLNLDDMKAYKNFEKLIYEDENLLI